MIKLNPYAKTLRDRIDLVTAGHHERGKRRGGERRANREATLLQVRLRVPLAPDLGRREHATTAAHVSEGALTRAARATAGNTRDTRNSAARAPRLSRGLEAGHLVDGVGLAFVLVDCGVHALDDIWADRGDEDRRKRHRLEVLGLVGREHGNHGSRSSHWICA